MNLGALVRSPWTWGLTMGALVLLAGLAVVSGASFDVAGVLTFDASRDELQACWGDRDGARAEAAANLRGWEGSNEAHRLTLKALTAPNR